MLRTFAAGLIRVGAALSMLGGLATVGPALGAAPSSQLAADSAAQQDKALFDFDIPAQPLDAALDQYAQITGQPAVFPSELVDGRIGSAVAGRYSAESGLQMLLQGTGLMAAQRSSRLGQTFVLQPHAVPAADAPRGGFTALFAEEGYAGLVQSRIWQSLCADERTRPDDYSALLRFQLGADGRLHHARLLGSSGDADRDVALLDALRRVRIGRAPPPGIAQQLLTLALTPDDPVNGLQCKEQQRERG